MMRPVQGKTALRRSNIHGRGVFATKDIKAGEIIEQMPALAIRHDEVSNKGWRNEYLFLHTHAYEPVGLHELWVGTGTLSFYNSSGNPNAEYEYDMEDDLESWITIIARRQIRKGQEITLHYGMK